MRKVATKQGLERHSTGSTEVMLWRTWHASSCYLWLEFVQTRCDEYNWLLSFNPCQNPSPCLYAQVSRTWMLIGWKHSCIVSHIWFWIHSAFALFDTFQSWRALKVCVCVCVFHLASSLQSLLAKTDTIISHVKTTITASATVPPSCSPMTCPWRVGGDGSGGVCVGGLGRTRCWHIRALTSTCGFGRRQT